MLPVLMSTNVEHDTEQETSAHHRQNQQLKKETKFNTLSPEQNGYFSKMAFS